MLDRRDPARVMPEPVEVTVDPAVHARALSYAYWASRRYSVDPPVIRWCQRGSLRTPTTGALRLGECRMWEGPAGERGSDVWLCADLGSTARLLDVTMHEAGHHIRHVKGLGQDEPDVEADGVRLRALYVLEVFAPTVRDRNQRVRVEREARAALRWCDEKRPGRGALR